MGVRVTVDIRESLIERVNLASAQVHLSIREYVEACVIAGLMCQSDRDADLKAVFRYLDSVDDLP